MRRSCSAVPRTVALRVASLRLAAQSRRDPEHCPRDHVASHPLHCRTVGLTRSEKRGRSLSAGSVTTAYIFAASDPSGHWPKVASLGRTERRKQKARRQCDETLLPPWFAVGSRIF